MPALSAARLLPLAAALGACGGHAPHWTIQLDAQSDVPSSRIHSIALYLAHPTPNMLFDCVTLLGPANPKDPLLGLQLIQRIAPGSPVSYGGQAQRGAGLLYVEAQASLQDAQVLAAGCTPVALPEADGDFVAMLSLFAVTDDDGDGWIGTFHLRSGDVSGSDCNDGDAMANPGPPNRCGSGPRCQQAACDPQGRCCNPQVGCVPCGPVHCTTSSQCPATSSCCEAAAGQCDTYTGGQYITTCLCATDADCTGLESYCHSLQPVLHAFCSPTGTQSACICRP